jgi:hypothetical protein
MNFRSSPLDFSWVIYKPIFEDNLFDEKNKPIYKYVLDNETAFSIETNHGVLERNAAKNFDFTFSPTSVSL